MNDGVMLCSIQSMYIHAVNHQQSGFFYCERWNSEIMYISSATQYSVQFSFISIQQQLVTLQRKPDNMTVQSHIITHFKVQAAMKRIYKPESEVRFH